MSFNDGSSKSNENANTSQNSVSQSFGSTTMAPINSQQISDALGLAGSMYGATAPGSALASQGIGQVGAGGQHAFGLANGAGLNQAAATLNGNYLSAGNPAFQQMANRVGAATRSTIDSGFEGAGRYGSPMAAHAQAQGVGDAIGALGYQNYGAERQNQMTALGQVPQLGQAMTAPGMTALQAGYTPLQQYLSSLSTLSPGKTSTTANNSNMAGNGTSQAVTNGSTSSKGLNIA